MSKDRFVELLKQAGYGSVQLEKGVVRIYIVGDKKDLAQAYRDITLFARKVGYNHSFGVKLLNEDIVTEEKPKIEAPAENNSVKDYVDNMPDSKE